MNLIKKGDFGTVSEKCSAEMPIAPSECFVNNVYLSVDAATACELERLRYEEGVIPSCQLGCCHCCQYLILTNIAEARTLAQYIKQKFSAEQISDLRMRTRQWHEWDNSRPGRYPAANIAHPVDLLGYNPCCPLLVNAACSAYPVRPLVCRTHFVCSQPRYCALANNPDSTEASPVVIASIVTAASPFATAIREHIENAGREFSHSVMLLPQWLAIEMGWNTFQSAP
jgi:Fe-S-cluster containining protein